MGDETQSTLHNLFTAPDWVQEGEMKPRPIKIQPGATHWNPNAGPDWYAKPFCGPWVYFDAEEGNWDNGQWALSIHAKLSDLIPVQELMAQHNGANSLSAETTQAVSENYTARLKREIEWSGEGLPPVGTECEVSMSAGMFGASLWVACTILAHDIGPDEIAVFKTKAGVYRGVTRDFFRPIKSEREKAIQAMNPIICSQGMFSSDGDACKAISAALYDAGYRKVVK